MMHRGTLGLAEKKKKKIIIIGTCFMDVLAACSPENATETEFLTVPCMKVSVGKLESNDKQLQFAII